MCVDAGSLDSWVTHTLRRAGLDTGAAPRLDLLVTELYGGGAIQRTGHPLAKATVSLPPEPVFTLAAEWSLVETNGSLANLLGKCVATENGVAPRDLTAVGLALGRRLALPTSAFVRTVATIGPSCRRLATHFKVPVSMIAARLGDRRDWPRLVELAPLRLVSTAPDASGAQISLGA